jgi:hypothetical protein
MYNYWDWLSDSIFYNMVFGVIAAVVFLVGYVIWVKLQEWYEGD